MAEGCGNGITRRRAVFGRMAADARMVKLVDTKDLKSFAREGVPVRVRLWAHFSRPMPGNAILI